MRRQSGPSEISALTRAELGIAAGFTASVMMAIGIIVITSLNLVQVPWFSVVGYIFGSSGLSYAVALNGLVWFMGIGVFGGLVFAFGFTSYSVNKGLGLAAIGLIITALILSMETVPPFSGTLVSMGLGSSLALLVPLAICYVVWGICVGIIARRYLK
ncbi:MAG: hypothetical protein M1368_02080 [Thaumarchaeota archaeon]|nr:hypothetical protein [Nitrososphaerota archaeon]